MKNAQELLGEKSPDVGAPGPVPTAARERAMEVEVAVLVAAGV